MQVIWTKSRYIDCFSSPEVLNTTCGVFQHGSQPYTFTLQSENWNQLLWLIPLIVILYKHVTYLLTYNAVCQYNVGNNILLKSNKTQLNCALIILRPIVGLPRKVTRCRRPFWTMWCDQRKRIFKTLMARIHAQVCDEPLHLLMAWHSYVALSTGTLKVTFGSIYRKVSNIRRTLLVNKVVDHSDVVGASPVGARLQVHLHSQPGFNGLGKDNCKTRRETSMFRDWVRLILENWRYMNLAGTGSLVHYM